VGQSRIAPVQEVRLTTSTPPLQARGDEKNGPRPPGCIDLKQGDGPSLRRSYSFHTVSSCDLRTLAGLTRVMAQRALYTKASAPALRNLRRNDMSSCRFGLAACGAALVLAAAAGWR